MIRITAPHFCAGAIFRHGKIVEAAPIIKWMIGRSVADMRRYCEQMAWRFEMLE